MKPDGTFADEVTDFAGRFCKEADRDIIRNLRGRDAALPRRGLPPRVPVLLARDGATRSSSTRARAGSSGRPQEIDRVIENNQAVHWEPEHIKDGRFGEFLRTNVDWALSPRALLGHAAADLDQRRDRQDGGDRLGRGASCEQEPRSLRRFRGGPGRGPEPLGPPDGPQAVDRRGDLDRSDGEPGVYRRVPEVIDCWFDSGCMPFAQWGYPHQNARAVRAQFPADFITEALDQTRGWFYSLMTISTLLFNHDQPYPHPFKNCVGARADHRRGRQEAQQVEARTTPTRWTCSWTSTARTRCAGRSTPAPSPARARRFGSTGARSTRSRSSSSRSGTSTASSSPTRTSTAGPRAAPRTRRP